MMARRRCRGGELTHGMEPDFLRLGRLVRRRSADGMEPHPPPLGWRRRRPADEMQPHPVFGWRWLHWAMQPHRSALLMSRRGLRDWPGGGGWANVDVLTARRTMRASAEIQGSWRISLRDGRTANRGPILVGLARRDTLEAPLGVQLVVRRNRPVDGDFRRHQERGSSHRRADDVDASAVEVLDRLLAEAEVGRGVASREGGVQGRPNLGLRQAVRSEEDQVAIEGKGCGEVDLVLRQELLRRS